MKVLIGNFYPFSPEVIYPEFATVSSFSPDGNEFYAFDLDGGQTWLPGLSILHRDIEVCPDNILLQNAIRMQSDYKTSLANVHFVETYLANPGTCERKQRVLKFLSEIDLSEGISRIPDFVYKGVNIGQYALFVSLRKNMASCFEDLEDANIESYKYQLKACAATIELLEEFIEKKGLPDVFLASHFAYGQTRTAYEYLKKLNPDLRYFPITTSNLFGSVMQNTYVVWEQNRQGFADFLRSWKKFKNHPRKDFHVLAKHYNQLLQGRSFRTGYSIAIQNEDDDFFDKWGWDRTKPTFLMGLSGSGERWASLVCGAELDGSFLFKDQFEWVKEVTQKLWNRKDIQIIIRPHPNETVKAKPTSEYLKLMEYSREFPDHIRLNSPEDKISSFSLMKYVRGVMVSWSSLSMDSALMGIPCIGYAQDHESYPMDEVVDVPSTKEAYFELLESWFTNPPKHNWKNSIKGVRWLKYFLEVAHLKHNCVVQYKKLAWSSWMDKYMRLFRKVHNTFYNPIHFDSRLQNDWFPMEESATRGVDLHSVLSDATCIASVEQEADELRTLLAQIGRVLYQIPPNYRLVLDPESELKAGEVRLVAREHDLLLGYLIEHVYSKGYLNA